MRTILTGLLLLWSIPAHAMNWEGHDDWMADMEPALIYQDAAPHAAPRKGDACTKARKEAQDRSEDNSYEQIPLASRACPPAPQAPGVEVDR